MISALQMDCLRLTSVCEIQFHLWWTWFTATNKAHNLSLQDSKVHWSNMGPTCVLSAPDWPHVGPMNWKMMADILQVACWNIPVIQLLVNCYSHVDGLIQERRNSSALSMEWLLSSNYPLMYSHSFKLSNKTVPATTCKIWALIQYKDVILPV